MLYQRNSDKLVVPASNMKLLTMSVAAERLGWDYRFETRLEAAGTIENGVAQRRSDRHRQRRSVDRVAGRRTSRAVPRMGGRAEAGGHPPRRPAASSATTTRSTTTGIGAGWAWDYLADDYAAPSGALSYNENVVTHSRDAWQGGRRPGHDLDVAGRTSIRDRESRRRRARPDRPRQSTRIGCRAARSSRSAGACPRVARARRTSTTIDNPTSYFVEALRAGACRSRRHRRGRGVGHRRHREPGRRRRTRRLIARRESAPLSALGAQLPQGEPELLRRDVPEGDRPHADAARHRRRGPPGGARDARRHGASARTRSS